MKTILLSVCKAVAIVSSALGIVAGIGCGNAVAVGVNLAVLVAVTAS